MPQGLQVYVYAQIQKPTIAQRGIMIKDTASDISTAIN